MLLFGNHKLHDVLLTPCRTSDKCSSFTTFEEHDPACTIDPTCVSPLYRGSTTAGTVLAADSSRTHAENMTRRCSMSVFRKV
jgi:hypothetical protein